MLGDPQLMSDAHLVPLSGRAAIANPLVAAAAPLFDVLAHLRLGTRLAPERLRDYLGGEIRRFQARAQEAGVPIERIVGARYCLCTALDEAAALAPWSDGGAWSAQSLLVAFHNETWGGEKFFQLLARVATDVAAHRDLIELQFLCLALGFQGRYRVIRNGAAQLDTLTRRLHKLLHDTGGGYKQALSPAWQATGREAALPPRPALPWWAWPVIAGGIGGIAFAGFRLTLDAQATSTRASIEAIRLPGIDARRPATLPAALARLLDADVRDGNIALRDEGGGTVIAIRGDGLFDSGSDVARAAYLPLIARVASVLERVDADIVITGHTDDQPLRDRRFASNLALSLSRAQAVRERLFASGLPATRRVSVAGRGADMPIDTNSSAGGRARNRRVEIVLFPVSAAQSNLTEADAP